MPSRRYRRPPISSRLLGRSRRGTYWSGFLIPPLAALAIGLLLMFFLGGLNDDTQQPASVEPKVLAPFFSSSVDYWESSIVSWAAEHNLDPNLVATVMQIESCGDPEALSSAGASGLFQVMPFHFKDGEDPYDPPTNAGRGLAYLSLSLETTGENVYLALAGYNGGISVVDLSEEAWADETRRYAEWGSGIYADALQGLSDSPTLASWLAQGGWKLCAQATLRLGLK